MGSKYNKKLKKHSEVFSTQFMSDETKFQINNVQCYQI